MIENRFFEGTNCLKSALESGMTGLKVMIASARSFSWGSNAVVTLLYLVTWPSTLTYRLKTQDLKHYDYHNWSEIPVMLQMALSFVYCFLHLWTFCQAVLLLTYVVATKIWSCCEFEPWNIIHILGFITPYFLHICLMIMAALAIFFIHCFGWEWI